MLEIKQRLPAYVDWINNWDNNLSNAVHAYVPYRAIFYPQIILALSSLSCAFDWGKSFTSSWMSAVYHYTCTGTFKRIIFTPVILPLENMSILLF